MSDKYEQKASEIAEKIYTEFGIMGTGLEKFLAEELSIAIREASKIDWPSEEEIRDVAKHEDSDGYFGFLAGCEWLKERIENSKKLGDKK